MDRGELLWDATASVYEKVETIPTLSDYGEEFNNATWTIRVRRGPNYGGYEVVRLCRGDYESGGYEEYGPLEAYRGALANFDGPLTSSIYFAVPEAHPPLVTSLGDLLTRWRGGG
jgi:hypothetical protein